MGRLNWRTYSFCLVGFSLMSTSLVASDEEMPTIEPIICQTNELSLSYDIRIGWISAGSMSAKVCMNGDEYGMRGNLRTRGPFERFLRWRGQFAADGAFESSIPQTYKYVVVEENLNKNKKKVVYMDQSGATVYASGKETRHVDAPAGADIMSSLLLSEMCRNTLVVHDGEEPYDINLYDIATGRRITQGSNHFNGID